MEQLKFPTEFCLTLTAEITDALGEDNIPVDQGKVAQLEKYFSNTVLGKIQQGSEDISKRICCWKINFCISSIIWIMEEWAQQEQ
jgi:hypothetical protein